MTVIAPSIHRAKAIPLLVSALLVTALILPVVVTNNFVLHALTMSLIFAILAASWDLLFGFAGQVSFGQAGFFGMGAYASALLSYYGGLSPWLGLFAGGAAASLFAFFVGFPSLRLRGVYLALATLACSEMLRIVVTNWVPVTRGTLGFNLHPGFPYIPHTPTAHYYVILAGAALSTGMMYIIAARSPVGLVLRAVAADDIRAQALGVDVYRMKLLAFSLSGFFAGSRGRALRLFYPASDPERNRVQPHHPDHRYGDDRRRRYHHRSRNRRHRHPFHHGNAADSRHGLRSDRHWSGANAVRPLSAAGDRRDGAEKSLRFQAGAARASPSPAHKPSRCGAPTPRHIPCRQSAGTSEAQRR